MPRLKEATRLERRRRIAAAALERFAVSGISGTSMADIIRASGLSSGAIYSHFDSKTELLRYVMSTMLEGRFTAVVAEPDAASTVTPDVLLTRLLAGPSTDPALTGVLVQVWGEMAKDRSLAIIAEENLVHLRELLVTTLTPWSEQEADTTQADELAARTADWLIAVTFGYATIVALRSADAPEDFHNNLVSSARSIGHPTRKR